MILGNGNVLAMYEASSATASCNNQKFRWDKREDVAPKEDKNQHGDE